MKEEVITLQQIGHLLNGSKMLILDPLKLNCSKPSTLEQIKRVPLL